MGQDKWAPSTENIGEKIRNRYGRKMAGILIIIISIIQIQMDFFEKKLKVRNFAFFKITF